MFHVIHVFEPRLLLLYYSWIFYPRASCPSHSPLHFFLGQKDQVHCSPWGEGGASLIQGLQLWAYFGDIAGFVPECNCSKVNVTEWKAGHLCLLLYLSPLLPQFWVKKLLLSLATCIGLIIKRNFSHNLRLMQLAPYLKLTSPAEIKKYVQHDDWIVKDLEEHHSQTHVNKMTGVN